MINDYLLRSTGGGANVRNNGRPLSAERRRRRTGDSVCDTNRRGYTRFIACLPGTYRLAEGAVALDDIAGLEEPVRQAIRFVVARELLGAAGRACVPSGAAISEADWTRALARLREGGVKSAAPKRPASRAEAATVLQTAVKQALGTAIDSPYTHAYLTRDRIRIGAWVNLHAEAITDDFIATYRSAGFDWIIAHGAFAGADRREWLLRECDRHGVELILGDGAYHNAAVATADYYDHPSFAGTYITDEPGTDQYAKWAEICKAYRRDTQGKLPYINLLPMYANAAQLKFGAHAAAIEYYDPDPALYKKYCDSFCQMFDEPYICTDIYPLNWSQGRRTTTKSIANRSTSSRVQREHDKDFWCCIQTFAWVPSKRTPTESEFRWQSYCMLSFGCKGLLCWTYAGYKPEFPRWCRCRASARTLGTTPERFSKRSRSSPMPLCVTRIWRDEPRLLGCYAVSKFSQPLERFPPSSGSSANSRC